MTILKNIENVDFGGVRFKASDIYVLPEITGPSGSPGSAISSKSIAENTAEVHVFTANELVTWSLSAGDDADKFSISNDGKLSFIAAPDFEAPTDTADTAGNNTYVVTVKAEDSTGNTAEQKVTVSVSNLDPLYPKVVFDPIGDTRVGSTITLDQIGSAPITVQSVQWQRSQRLW